MSSPRPTAGLRCLLAVGALLLAAGGAAASDPPGREVVAALEWEPGVVGGVPSMYVPFRTDPPEGLRAPAGAGDPRYARIRWGTGRGLSLVLDLAPASTRLWVDTDLDGDLEDEEQTAWAPAGMAWTREETVLVAYDDEAEPVPAAVQFYRHTSWPADRVRITPRVHRRGEVVLAGRLRLVALVDGNADLRFDDPERDHLYVDVDGDGALHARTPSHERLEPGRPFRVGDEGWKVEATSPSGQSARFVRVAEVPPSASRPWPYASRSPAGRAQTPPPQPFEELARRLEEEASQPYATRVGTINLMGRVGTEEALEALLRLVREEEDLSIRGAAVRALGNPAYLEAGGDAVVEMTRDPNASISSAAVQALHGMGHPRRRALFADLLESSVTSVVGAAARYLAYEQTPETRELLLRAWEKSTQDVMRYQVYLGLRMLEEGPPEAAMLEAARSDYVSLQGQGLRDLFARGHEEARKLALEAAERRPVSVSLAPALVEVLASIGDGPSVTALLDILPDIPSSQHTRLVQGLSAARSPEAQEALVRALKAPEPSTRALVAQILGGNASPEVTRAIVRRVKKERDENVRVALLEALGDHGSPEAVRVLLEQARRRNASARRAAVRALARCGLDEPEVHRLFVSLLEARTWEERVLAIDAVAASGERGLCGRIARSLDHEQRQVRLAAAEAMGRLRCAEAVLPLIGRLEEEEEPRIRDALAASLYRITGMNLYDEAPVWRRWWNDHGATFEMPETVPDLPPADAGGTRAGFYGIPVRSGRVIFVIDQSGSMSAQDAGTLVTGQTRGTRLEVAVREAIQAIEGLSSRDRVNVILFHTTIHPWRPELQRLTKANRRALRRHLEAQRPTGGTNLYDGLELALSDPEVDTIFLLSDGAPGLGRYVATEDILRGVRHLNQVRRIAVHCVSVGRDSDLMRRLAAENGGKYVRR